MGKQTITGVGHDRGPISQLVRHIVNTRYEHLTDGAIEYARKAILDTIGVTIAGSSAEHCRAVVELVKDWGEEESTI